MSKTEEVLVIPRSLFEHLGEFQGFNNDVRYIEKISSSNLLQYMNRDIAEVNENYKQIIPYTFLTHEDKIFTYKRTKKGSEDRLKEKLSIGIGGHINPVDSKNPIIDGLKRELHEELQIDTLYEIFPIGLINDDSNEVGKVHLGICFEVQLLEPNASSNEDQIEDLGFLDMDQLCDVYEHMETWSQILFKSFWKEIYASKASYETH